MEQLNTAEEKLEYLNTFLDEQFWYTTQLIEDAKISPIRRKILEEKLEEKLWFLRDIKSVLKGEL